MAYAGAVFADALMRAINGESGVTTPAFVESPLYKDQGVDFFASQITLGPNGVEKIHPVGTLDASEQKLIDACLPELKKNIEKGIAFTNEGAQSAPKGEPTSLRSSRLERREDVSADYDCASSARS